MRKRLSTITQTLRVHLSAVLIVALSLALRLAGLTRHGLWVDEGVSVYLASHPLREMLAGVVVDQHPPLYYLLVRGWILCFGQSEGVIRGLSVLVGTGTVLLVYIVGRKLFSRRTGELAALAMALSPAHIWYSQEVRMYALLVLLLTASAYLAWRVVEDSGRGVWAGYVLVTLAGLYTQYFTLFILLFENLWLLPMALARGKRKRLGPWLVAQSCLLLGFAPWTPVLIFQILFREPVWIVYGTWSGLADVILYLTTGPWWGDRPLWARLSTWAWLALVPLVAGLWSLRRPQVRRPALFTWGWFLLPLAAIFVFSQRWRLFQAKQFIFLLPPLFLLAGLGLSRLPRVGQILAGVAFIALLLPGLHTTYFRLEKQEWRELAAYIDLRAREGDCIFFNASPGAPILNYYLRSELPQDGYPFAYRLERGGYDGEVTTPERVDAQLSSFAAGCQRIWLVEFSPGFWDPQGLIRSWLDTHAQPEEVPSFYELGLHLYTTRD